MRKYPSSVQNYLCYNVDIKSFYKSLSDTNFATLNRNKLCELQTASKKLNQFFENKDLEASKLHRYVKLMNTIKTNPKGYNVFNEAEKFILFMMSVDPNFEAIKIYSESDHKTDIKKKMEKTFGIYDSNLISIEKFFIKHFLSEKKRNEIKEEIEKRVFK